MRGRQDTWTPRILKLAAAKGPEFDRLFLIAMAKAANWGACAVGEACDLDDGWEEAPTKELQELGTDFAGHIDAGEFDRALALIARIRAVAAAEPQATRDDLLDDPNY